MTDLKRILELPRGSGFNDWSQIHSVYESSCYCTSITTDIESYIEVEALKPKCLEDLCQAFQELGFEPAGPAPIRQRGQQK